MTGRVTPTSFVVGCSDPTHASTTSRMSQAPAITFTWGKDIIPMKELKGVKLEKDKELEVLYEYPFSEDHFEPKHLGPYTIQHWWSQLEIAYNEDPSNFETNWVRRKYTCMPWRYFAALAQICDEKLKKPLKYFRIDKPLEEATKAKEAKEREQRREWMMDVSTDWE